MLLTQHRGSSARLPERWQGAANHRLPPVRARSYGCHLDANQFRPGRASLQVCACASTQISTSARVRRGPTTLPPPLPPQVGEFDTAKGLPVPHIGWNTLRQARSSDLLAAVAPTDRVYFVHSFRLVACWHCGGVGIFTAVACCCPAGRSCRCGQRICWQPFAASCVTCKALAFSTHQDDDCVCPAVTSVRLVSCLLSVLQGPSVRGQCRLGAGDFPLC